MVHFDLAKIEIRPKLSHLDFSLETCISGCYYLDIYLFALLRTDLGGNTRKGLRVSNANVFGIIPGMSINFFIRRGDNPKSKAKIFHSRVDESWHKEKIFEYLISKKDYRNIEWNRLTPDNRHTWLTEGLHAEFHTFIPMGTQKAKALHRRRFNILTNMIFRTYSNGVKINRDAWTYNFNRNALIENMGRMINTYNAEVDDFVDYDDTKIKWSGDLKLKLKSGTTTAFSQQKVRTSLYRPFTTANLYFDRVMNNRVYVFPTIFPASKAEMKNKLICVAGIRNRKDFGCLTRNRIPSIDLAFEKIQCFPFYTYDESGKNRRENITRGALDQFRAHY